MLTVAGMVQIFPLLFHVTNKQPTCKKKISIVPNNFPYRLQIALAKAGMNKLSLSKKTGIAASTISRWFGAEGNAPSLEKIEKIAEALNVRREWLSAGIGPSDLNLRPEDQGQSSRAYISVAEYQQQLPLAAKAAIEALGLSADSSALSDAIEQVAAIASLEHKGNMGKDTCCIPVIRLLNKLLARKLAEKP